MGQTTSLTQEGQVTIPEEIRDALGLKPFDTIEIYLENGEAKLRKAYPSLDELAGSVPGIDVPMEEWSAIIRDEVAEAYARKFLK